MVELETIHVSTAKHFRNLGAYCIVKISSILRSIHIVLKNSEKIEFYINNYINWDQFIQLYAFGWLGKDIRNIDEVAQKLLLASTKTTNLRRKRAKKKQEVVD